VLAWQATVGDGIAEGSLVPFHYLGLKDDVDFEQIPWRNGSFDPTTLEEKLENSERMERLWTAWQADPDARTLVFCCSRRHALYTRDWLRRRQVRAAAVFSGSGGDPRSESLTAFIDGSLQALCVVDLFNEGLDVPTWIAWSCCAPPNPRSSSSNNSAVGSALPKTSCAESHRLRRESPRLR
jgi:superfamily II DNA or RNA helicase